jgi:hypothetical protein
MQTDCSSNLFGFQDLGQKKVVADFNGGTISSDAGGLLLREVAITSDYLRDSAACFYDYRNQRFVEHSVQDRIHQRDKGKACEGKSTLNRRETSEGFFHITGTKKIEALPEKIENFFVKSFLKSYPGRPKEIVLDMDVIDNELHAKQEGRFFHGYYDCHCYLPLYIYCSDYLLCAKLRKAAKQSPAAVVDSEGTNA